VPSEGAPEGRGQEQAGTPERHAPAGGPAAARAARLTREPDCTSYG